MVLSRNKHLKYRTALAAVTRRHHFSNSNTFEIVFTLLVISVVSRLLTFISREARY